MPVPQTNWSRYSSTVVYLTSGYSSEASSPHDGSISKLVMSPLTRAEWLIDRTILIGIGDSARMKEKSDKIYQQHDFFTSFNNLHLLLWSVHIKNLIERNSAGIDILFYGWGFDWPWMSFRSFSSGTKVFSRVLPIFFSHRSISSLNE